ncbi:hypothetical protein NEOLEDRAFT_1034592, partial [Neolentinus lepideus HHB14362 ss-1]
LLSLPAELRGLVVGYIDKPNDLLALALTCRDLYRLLVPDHLEYCQIRTFLCAEELWDHL